MQVKSKKMGAFFYGSINRFLLYGAHDADVFATGGVVELTLVSSK